MCRNLCRRLLASLPAKYLTAKYLNLLWQRQQQRQQHTFSFTFAGPLLFLAGIAGIFYAEPLLILMMCDAFVRCLQNMFAFWGNRERCLSLIISLLNRGKRWRKLCQFVGLSLVSLEHALCVYSQMWHSQWPKGYTRWRKGKGEGRTRSTGNCQLPIKKPSALASRQLICM